MGSFNPSLLLLFLTILLCTCFPSVLPLTRLPFESSVADAPLLTTSVHLHPVLYQSRLCAVTLLATAERIEEQKTSQMNYKKIKEDMLEMVGPCYQNPLSVTLPRSPVLLNAVWETHRPLPVVEIE